MNTMNTRQAAKMIWLRARFHHICCLSRTELCSNLNAACESRSVWSTRSSMRSPRSKLQRDVSSL